MNGLFPARPDAQWRSAHRDLPHRQGMIENLERILVDAEKVQHGTISARRREELRTIAKQWELKLYQQAPSFDAYIDRSTFEGRVQGLVRGSTSGRQDEAAAQHHHQRLHLFRHALTCQADTCTVTPFCRDMKDVCSHLEDCRDPACQVPFCGSMRQLMLHSRACRSTGCQVCAPEVRVPDCRFCEDGEESTPTALRQEYLLTLLHASACPHEGEGQCPVTPLCSDLKRVWMHKIYCSNAQCQYPFCATSRALVDHYNSCRGACAVCTPVRATIAKHGINKLRAEEEGPPRCVEIPTPRKAAAKEGASSSGTDVVASQVAIYEKIRKRRVSGMSAAGAAEASSGGTSGSDAAMSDVSPDKSCPSIPSATSAKSEAELDQMREYERLAAAHKQRQQAQSTVPKGGAYKTPPSIEQGKKGTFEYTQTRMNTRAATDYVQRYFATTYSTQTNTEPVVCSRCQVTAFVPSEGTKFCCQRCSEVTEDSSLSLQM